MHKVGPTKASKLLARKRPALVPIYDSVISQYLRPPPGAFWTSLAQSLADKERRRRIDALAPPDLPSSPTTLRLLDVAVWMRGGGSTNAKAARAWVELPAEPLVAS